MLLLAGFWLVLNQRYTQPAQAQIGKDGVLNIEALLQNASEVVQGGYQTEPTGDYNLWQYRTDGIYQKANECDAKDDGNEIPEEPLDWEGPGGGPSENFNDVTKWGLDGKWKKITYTDYWGTHTYWEFTETGFLSGTEYCEDRNMPDFGDNLKYDSSFPTRKPHYTRADNSGGAPTRPVSLNGGGRTPSAHDWNTSGLEDANELEGMKPFLAIGVTASKGLRSPIVELNAWIPKEHMGQLTIEAENFCGSDIWDTGTTGNSNLYMQFEGSATKPPITCAANGNGDNFQVSLSDLGEPKDVRTFTHYDGSNVSQKVYKLYKITAGTSLAANSSTYTNQFRLKITEPATDGYLGIAKTRIQDSSKPENALGVGMRLPGDNSGDPPTFKRLKILWEIDLYVAIDPEEGCSAKNVEGVFGLYDTDFSGSTWLPPPSLEIFSVPRNEFLNGDPVTWNQDKKANEIYTFGDSNNAHNVWDSETRKVFDGDKIYHFHFYNLDQRSWMQIGIPFAQFNALQKCIDRPLVKIYHGDISVGGRFGSHTTGSACLKDDLTSPTPAAAIYAHVKAEGEGSYGSSAEYGVYARGEIDGFYSKFKRGQDPPPDPTQELTFANNDANLDWGGGWGGQLRCMPNYWREVDKELDAHDPPSPEIDLGDDLTREDIQNTRKLYVPQAEKFTITNTDPDADLQLKTTIYVKGDLYINANIINENEELTTQNQIYLIYLIVKGNIFIASDVTRIDAVLIAMPSDEDHSQKGRIYTCYIEGLTDSTDSTLDIHSYDTLIDKDAMMLEDTNQLHEQECRTRLTVNGALIARQVHLGRVTNPDEDDGRITEEINLLPEYFIGSPQLPPHSDWFYKSDSITTLPTNF